jgi:hypothetical protein
MAGSLVSPWVNKLDQWREEAGYTAWDTFCLKKKLPFGKAIFSSWQYGKIIPSVQAMVIISMKGFGFDAPTTIKWLTTERPRRDTKWQLECDFYISLLNRISPDFEIKELYEQLSTHDKATIRLFIKGMIDARQANI